MSQRRRSPNGPRPSPSAAVKAAVPGAQGAYTLTVSGKAYSLPAASVCAPRVPAGALIDAVMDGGDVAELRLGLSMLKALGEDGKPLVDPAALEALRSLPMDKFTEHLSAWMTTTGAVAPGESVSSSS